jgi:hypothetical protein
MVNEATVVAGETKEGADVFDGSGNGPVLDCLNFCRIHGNSVLGDDVAEEFDGEFSERTLVEASEVVVLAQDTKDEGQVFGVLSGVLGKNENIIEEDHDEVVKVGAKDVVHGTLERSGCIGETKGHDFELVVAVTSTECCLGNIILSNAYLPVARLEINFGEDRGSLETVEEFFCTGNGVAVLDRLFVEGAEVDAEAKSTPFLTNEEDWRAVGRFGWFDEASSEEICELNSALIEFRDGEPVRGEEGRWSSGVGDGNGVIHPWTVWWDVP